ncbi:MAG: calcium/sodium antiporter [Sedimentisphaerales bacterium]|nr:calcium/sodium antiporter [Sedimentisphaerales bacterium]
MVLVHVLVILLSCGALWLGATWLVNSAARLAKKLGVSELVIGLTVVAFGTSAPELAVSVGAALKGQSDIAVGNVVGSNIFNIGFILGMCAVLTTIATKKALVWRDGLLLLLVTVLLGAMGWDGELGRWEGAVLAAILVGYLAVLFVKREQAVDEELPGEAARWLDGVLLLAGLVLVIGGGHFLVESAVVVAEWAGLSQWVIGMTVVAAGTSLPEFVISLVAVLKQHHGISAGNLIGSNLFNTLGVLGVAGAIHPMAIDNAAMINIGGLAVLTVVVMVFMETHRKLLRWEGVVLLLLSAALWGYNFYVGAGAAS